MKRKVLWFIENTTLGGQQTQSINLIEELKEDTLIDVAYLNSGPLLFKFEEVANKTYHIGDLKPGGYKNPKNTAKLILSYFSLLKRNKYDVVMSNGVISFGLTSLMKFFFKFKHARLLGGPLIDIEPTYEKYFHKILPFHKGVDVAYGWAGENRIEKKRYQNKLHIMPAGVNTKMFTEWSNSDKVELRKKYNIEEDRVVVGWVGRIAANMQVKNTIHACGELRKRGFDNFTLLIVGGGSWEKEMLAMIENYNLADNCMYLGWQPMELIPELFQLMDIVPLLEDDPVGGSIVREGMATGALVVTVDGKSKGQSSWITHKDNGILVSDQNYIEETATIIENYRNNIDENLKIRRRGTTYAKECMSFKNQAEFIKQFL